MIWKLKKWGIVMKKLTQQEFLVKFKEYKQGNEEMLNELIADYTWMVDNAVKRYSKFIDDQAQIYSCGLNALWQALKNYDENNDSYFVSYAYIYIRNAIALLYNSNEKDKRNLKKYQDRLDINNKIDFIYEYEEKELQEIINNLIIEIPSKRDSKIMQIYFHTSYTREDIAKIFNISHQRVSQIIMRELTRIKLKLYNLGLLNVNNKTNNYQNIYEFFKDPVTGKYLDQKVVDMVIATLPIEEQYKYIVIKEFTKKDLKIFQQLLAKLKSLTVLNIYDISPDSLIKLYKRYERIKEIKYKERKLCQR